MFINFKEDCKIVVWVGGVWGLRIVMYCRMGWECLVFVDWIIMEFFFFSICYCVFIYSCGWGFFIEEFFWLCFCYLIECLLWWECCGCYWECCFLGFICFFLMMGMGWLFWGFIFVGCLLLCVWFYVVIRNFF